MPVRLEVVKHLPEDELEERYRREKNSRVKEKLQAVLLLYDGEMTVREVSEVVRRSTRAIEKWVRRWNTQGYDGLVPRFTGGPKPRVTSEEWDRIIGEVEEKGMTIRDVTEYVRRTRRVSYSYKTVWEILRKEKKVRYGKPYIRNSLRPENAEEILKKE
jgi:putative transposase